MKRLNLLVTVMMSLVCLSVHAQDIIVMQNGDVVKGFRVDVADKAVFYADVDTDEADIHRLKKSDVLVIKKSDGTVIHMTEGPQSQTSSTESNKPFVLSAEQKEKAALRNNKILSAVNQDIIQFNETPKKDKYPKHILCQFYADENSVFDDGVLQVSYNLGRVLQKYNGEIKEILEYDKLYNETTKGKKIANFRDAVRPILTNKTDKIIYVDLALSFFTQEGISTPYYVPSSTSVSEGSISSASVNLGGIAKAAGVGGALGSLASAVNVGGGKTSSSTTTTYSQRIVTIPPHSSVTLGFMVLHPNITPCAEKPFVTQRTWNANYCMSKLTFFIPKDNPLYNGRSMYFDMDNTPMDWSTYFVYGFDENIEQKFSVQQRMYLSKMMGGSFWGESLTMISGFDDPSIIWIIADHRN